MIDRRQLLGGACAVLAGVVSSEACADAATDFSMAQTTGGLLRGARERGVCVFKGIPYGGPVSGAMRFRPPTPAPRWSGTRDALAFGAQAIQAADKGLGSETPPYTTGTAEDCLFLNVWTPAIDARRRPVMFYNHGGGFFVGSAEKAAQNGANLAREYDVVVVESNHRLGLLGYLFLADILGPDYPGNQGMLDIVAALDWTAANIAGFGGDPANVMIFGESGGGAKTSALYAMPKAQPLFSKASFESGPAWRFVTRDAANATTQAVLHMLDIPHGQARRLLDVSVADLLAVQERIPKGGGPITFGAPPETPAPLVGFAPVVDGLILPADPFAPTAPPFAAGKPLIVGITRDERVFQHLSDPAAFTLDEAGLQQRLHDLLGDHAAAVLAVYRRLHPDQSPSWLYLRIDRDASMWSSAIMIAERKWAQHAAPVFMYELDYASATPVPGTTYPIGAPHSSDIFLKFDTVPAASAQPTLFERDQSAGRHAAAKVMSEMWTTYARTSHPGAHGQPGWPPYTPDDRATMLIDAHCQVVVDPDKEARLLWQTLRPDGA